MPRTFARSRLLPPLGYAGWLLVGLLAWLAWWSIAPKHPADFLLEHILTVLFLGGMIWSHGRYPLSHASYTMLALFVALHAVGAHSTYSEVPYERWFRTISAWMGVRDFSFNATFGFERNHYDRLVHFAFGLLFVLPVWEVSRHHAHLSRWWGGILTFSVIQAASLLYEIAEWLIALIMSEGVSQSYLGTQGDVWDAQKDMALATVGSILALALVILLERRSDRSRPMIAPPAAPPRWDDRPVARRS